MICIWDEEKNKINRQKHGIDFALAGFVFTDPKALSWLDNRFLDSEERWLTLGCINEFLIVVVAHTFGGNENETEIIRLISARKATKKERDAYWKSHA